jgi:hypothetical protein
MYFEHTLNHLLTDLQLLQSVVMLMFREEKSPEDEIKAWQFWHGRQHSVKQRILDAGEYENNLLTEIFNWEMGEKNNSL